MNKIIQPIVLCGGSGTRLWPLSTSERPKQLLSVGDKTLLQRTLDRLSHLPRSLLPPILIMNQQHRDDYQERVIYEPFSNDTAVATLRAAQAAPLNSYLLVLPADHYIYNEEAFLHDIEAGLEQVTPDTIVLFGLSPTSPESKYGYIIPGPTGILFREKPSSALAAQYIAQGALWNSGIFVARRELLLQLLHPLQDWIDHPRCGKAPSFDVAVLQEYSNIVAHSCHGWAWSDVGTWDAFLLLPEVIEEVYKNTSPEERSRNISILHRGQGRLIVLGCQDLTIIQEGENTLIMGPGEHSSLLKKIVEGEKK